MTEMVNFEERLVIRVACRHGRGVREGENEMVGQEEGEGVRPIGTERRVVCCAALKE